MTFRREIDEATGLEDTVVLEHKQDLHPQVLIKDKKSGEIVSFAAPVERASGEREERDGKKWVVLRAKRTLVPSRPGSWPLAPVITVHMNKVTRWVPGCYWAMPHSHKAPT